MKRLIPLVLCGVLGACATQEPAEAPVASAAPVEQIEEVPEEPQVTEVQASLPEVRYYVISEA